MSSSVGKQFPSISPRVDTWGSACLFNSQAWEKVCWFCWIWLEHGIMFDIYIQHTHTPKKIEHKNPTKIGATDSFMCCGFVWFPKYQLMEPLNSNWLWSMTVDGNQGIIDWVWILFGLPHWWDIKELTKSSLHTVVFQTTPWILAQFLLTHSDQNIGCLMWDSPNITIPKS